ncbi:MAG: tetratricopeptide repeat protein, partial [Opitutales bacterium]
MEAVLGTAMIVHHGYDPGLVKRRQKIKRNLRLLERAIQEMPNEAALVMNYGLDLVNDGRLEEGLVQYRRAFRLMEPHPAEAILPEVRERLLTIYGVHLLRADRFEEVAEVMTSRLAKDCGPTASLHFLAGAALMKLGRNAEAIPHLKDCLEKRNEPALTPPCQQIFKGGPRQLLAECFAKLEQYEEAEKSFKEALGEDPESLGLLHDYAYFLHQRKQSLEALQILHGVLGKGIDDLRIWHLGSLISNSRPEFVEFALDWTAEAIKFYPEHSGIGLARGEALMKSERLSEAIPYFKMEPHAGEPAAMAAIMLAELVEGNVLPAVPVDQEPSTSREFIAWYRRLLAAKAQKTLASVNSKVEVLRKRLPTAGEMLTQALNEAGPLDE